MYKCTNCCYYFLIKICYIKKRKLIAKVKQSLKRMILGWIRALGKSKYRWHIVANDDNDHGRQL